MYKYKSLIQFTSILSVLCTVAYVYSAREKVSAFTKLSTFYFYLSLILWEQNFSHFIVFQIMIFSVKTTKFTYYNMLSPLPYHLFIFTL